MDPEHQLEADHPLLGICLGMQLLASHGVEAVRTAATLLDLILFQAVSNVFSLTHN